MPRSAYLIDRKYAVNSFCGTSIYFRGHGNAMPLPFVTFFFFTAVFMHLNHNRSSRGTAPVRLLYIREDCGCRAPTVWSIYLKIAVNYYQYSYKKRGGNPPLCLTMKPKLNQPKLSKRELSPKLVLHGLQFLVHTPVKRSLQSFCRC